MPVIVFKGDGPCPHCDSAIAALEAANIGYTVSQDTHALFQVGSALGLRGRPIVVWASVGWGDEAKALVEAAKEASNATGET